MKVFNGKLFQREMKSWSNAKDGWNNCDYYQKHEWLKNQKCLYPEQGDIFNCADVYARTPYHLLPNDVHELINQLFNN